MKRLKNALGLFVFVAGIYAFVAIFPNYFANYQFTDEVASIAKFANSSDDAIRKEVMKKVASHSLPINEEDVIITHDGPLTVITIDYTVTVNLIVRSMVLDFHVTSKAPNQN